MTRSRVRILITALARWLMTPRSWIGPLAVFLGALALWAAGVSAQGPPGDLEAWRQTRLHSLLLLGGWWLVAAGSLTTYCCLVHRKSAGAEAEAREPPRKTTATRIALTSLILAYAVTYSWLTLERHWRFNSTGYDLAIKEQVIWNTAHGRLFASSPEVDNAFQDHFQPIMLAFVPPYALIPHTELLLLAQTLALAAGAIPLFRLARRRLSSDALALVMSSAYLLSPSLGFVNRFDFHPEAFAIPALLAALEALDRADLSMTSVWLLVPLLAKENLGLTVAAFGLYALAVRRHKLFGLAWTAIGLFVFVTAAFWLIPTLRGGITDTVARYDWLGSTPGEMLATAFVHPARVWEFLAKPGRALYLLQLLVPTGFLALLGFPELLLALPGLATNLLADHFCQSQIYCQYTVPILPFVAVAAVTGLAVLRRLLHGQRAWLTIGLAVLVPAVLSFGIDNPFTEKEALPPPLERLSNEEAVRRALAVVPPEISLVTTNSYAPHLAQRQELYIIGLPAQREAPADPEAVFINLYDQRFIVCEQYRDYFAGLDLDRYGLLFRDSGLVVAVRGGGSNEAFRDFVLNWTDCAG
jgi:uncharacterized membrane protein